MATSAPSTFGCCSSVTSAGCEAFILVTCTSTRSPTLNRSEADVRRVHANPDLGSAGGCHGRHKRGHDVALQNWPCPPVSGEALQRVSFRQHVATRAAEGGASLVDSSQAPVDGRIRHLLKLGIERRLDGQPRLVERFGAVLLLELLANLLDEIRGDGTIRRRLA